MKNKISNTEPLAIGLLLSDTHLKEANIALVTDIFHQACDTAEERGINTIFHAGDFFDKRKAQSQEVLLAGMDILEIFEKRGINFKIIAGNHDKQNLSSYKSYLDLYRRIPNIELIKNEYFTWIYKGCSIHCLPFLEDSIYVNELVERIIPKAQIDKNFGLKNILISHQGVDTVRNNDGNLHYSALKTDLFAIFDRAYFGHYHNKSELSDNISYFGSAYQANYGEDDQKGFTILYNDATDEFIQSRFPKFTKLTSSLSGDNIQDQLEKCKNLIKVQPNVRLVLHGKQDQLQDYQKAILELEKLGVDVQFENQVQQQDDIEKFESLTLSFSEMLEYVGEYEKVHEVHSDITQRMVKFIQKANN